MVQPEFIQRSFCTVEPSTIFQWLNLTKFYETFRNWFGSIS